MKKFVIGIAILSTLSSCMKTIHTHQQVMQSFRTRDDVKKQFGPPDEIMESNGSATWLYNCDTLSNFAHSSTVVKINGTFNPAGDTSGVHSVKVAQFTTYNKYTTFTFDAKGNVLTYYSYKVNFAEKKSNGLGTGLLIGGVALALLVLLYHADGFGGGNLGGGSL